MDRSLHSIVRMVLALGAGSLLVGTAWAAGNRRPSDEERGRELYETHCRSCHGAAARGDGPVTTDLVVPVPSLAGKVTDDDVNALVEVVLQGRGAMPGFEATFDRYDARRVLRHTARLAQGPAPEPVTPPKALQDPSQAEQTDETDTDATDAPDSDDTSTDAP